MLFSLQFPIMWLFSIKAFQLNMLCQKCIYLPKTPKLLHYTVGGTRQFSHYSKYHALMSFISVKTNMIKSKSRKIKMNTIRVVRGHSVAKQLHTHLQTFIHRDTNRQTKTNIQANTHMQTDTHKHTEFGHPGRGREMETLTVFIT